jgi:hypothetical protein
MKDKFSALWISYSSSSDYLRCPRAYYLKNIYRDPRTNHKITLMSPALALGQVVHDTIDSLSTVPSDSRFLHPLTPMYEKLWVKVSGTKGGFSSEDQETKFKNRGFDMLSRIMRSPGPLANKAVKLRQELPYYWLSEEDNIILCGKIDWLEYFPEDDSVHIIDFKTGKFDEDPDSLQLLMYFLLAKHCQTREVKKMSYWYIDRDDAPAEMPLPKEADAEKRVMEIAKKIQLARKLERFVCPQKDGCVVCRPLEAIVNGKATFIGTNERNADVYTNPIAPQTDLGTTEVEAIF